MQKLIAERKLEQKISRQKISTQRKVEQRNAVQKVRGATKRKHTKLCCYVMLCYSG